MHHAASRGHMSVIKELIRRKCDLNAENDVSECGFVIAITVFSARIESVDDSRRNGSRVQREYDQCGHGSEYYLLSNKFKESSIFQKTKKEPSILIFIIIFMNHANL